MKKYSLLFIIFIYFFPTTSIFASPPNWSVDPSDYQFTANITGVLIINNEYAEGDSNIIGAFSGEVCRGVEDGAIQVGDLWLYFMTIYSNANGDTISFKTYVADLDTILNIQETVEFSSNEIWGSPSDPFEWHAVCEVDNPPIVEGIPDQTIQAGEAFSIFDLDDYLTELDGDPIIWSYSGNQALSVEINSENEVTVTPPDSIWSGSEILLFTATDSTENMLSDSDSTLFTVLATDYPPIAADDSVSGYEDNSIFIDILENDYDPGGEIDSSSVTIVTEPEYGVLEITPLGEAIFSPDLNFWGNDSFAYTVADSAGNVSDIATVFIDVLAVNDAPIAVNDSVITSYHTAIDIPVLQNDYDIDSPIDTASISIIDSAAYGNIIVASNGIVEYSPNVGFYGMDSFTYTVSDTQGSVSNAATVTVIVEPSAAVDHTVHQSVPEKFQLSANFPNPFNPETKIEFEIPQFTTVSIGIYDASGKLVKTLIDEPMEPGYHSVIWHGNDDNDRTVNSGVYFYKMRAGNYSEVMRCVLLR